MVKSLPSVRETWVQSLDREDPREKETAVPYIQLPKFSLMFIILPHLTSSLLDILWKCIQKLTIFHAHSAIRIVSSAYLRLMVFLLAILIPACASSSPAYLMMHSAYKLNKHGDNIQPWHTPFPIWNQSVVLCPVLTIASWPAYRFLKTSWNVKSSGP